MNKRVSQKHFESCSVGDSTASIVTRFGQLWWCWWPNEGDYQETAFPNITAGPSDGLWGLSLMTFDSNELYSTDLPKRRYLIYDWSAITNMFISTWLWKLQLMGVGSLQLSTGMNNLDSALLHTILRWISTHPDTQHCVTPENKENTITKYSNNRNKVAAQLWQSLKSRLANPAVLGHFGVWHLVSRSLNAYFKLVLRNNVMSEIQRPRTGLISSGHHDNISPCNAGQGVDSNDQYKIATLVGELQ